jgi:hypothetical protein
VREFALYTERFDIRLTARSLNFQGACASRQRFQKPRTHELFQVAIDDPNQAKMAVREASQAAPASIVDVDGELSSVEIAQLELEPGQVRRAP